MPMRTPKEKYEQGKAERKERNKRVEDNMSKEDEMAKILIDFLDRFVTAVERIADSLEKSNQDKKALYSTSRQPGTGGLDGPHELKETNPVDKSSESTPPPPDWSPEPPPRSNHLKKDKE